MLRRFLILFPMFSFVAFLYVKSSELGAVTPSKPVGLSANTAIDEDDIQRAVINPLPPQMQSETLKNNPEFGQEAKKSPKFPTKVAQVKPRAMKIHTKNRKSESRKASSVIRRAVTQNQMDAVIYSNGQEEPEMVKKQDKKISKYENPALVGDVGTEGEPMKEAGSKWIEGISGSRAKLTLTNSRESECSDSEALCAKVGDRHEIPVFGVVVKSRADSYVPSRVKGNFKSGNFIEATPAVYID